MATKTANKTAPPAPRRSGRIPAAGRVMAEALRKEATPEKWGVVLTENTDGEVFHSENFRVTKPLDAGVLKERNSFDGLAAFDDMEVGDILAAAAAAAAAQGGDVDAAAAQGGNDA